MLAVSLSLSHGIHRSHPVPELPPATLCSARSCPNALGVMVPSLSRVGVSSGAAGSGLDRAGLPGVALTSQLSRLIQHQENPAPGHHSLAPSLHSGRGLACKYPPHHNPRFLCPEASSLLQQRSLDLEYLPVPMQLFRFWEHSAQPGSFLAVSHLSLSCPACPTAVGNV